MHHGTCATHNFAYLARGPWAEECRGPYNILSENRLQILSFFALFAHWMSMIENHSHSPPEWSVWWLHIPVFYFHWNCPCRWHFVSVRNVEKNIKRNDTKFLILSGTLSNNSETNHADWMHACGTLPIFSHAWPLQCLVFPGLIQIMAIGRHRHTGHWELPAFCRDHSPFVNQSMSQRRRASVQYTLRIINYLRV